MNPQGTSFIPQRPTSGTIKRGGVKKVYILTYISFIVFFGTIVGTAGTYAYQTLEQTKLNQEKKLLAAEKAKFNEADLDTIRVMYYRMQNAKDRLNAHISLLPIFKSLEQSAVQTLVFKGFDFKRINQEIPSITFSGTAKNFDSVMFQRGLFESSPLFADSVMTGFSLTDVSIDAEATQKADTSDESKIVSFTVTAPVKASLIGYTAPVSSTTNATSTDINSSNPSAGTNSVTPTQQTQQ